MRVMFGLILLCVITGCCNFGQAPLTTTVILPRDSASYFCLQGKLSEYMVFRPDGHFSVVMWPAERYERYSGTWTQGSDGVVTLVSSRMRAPIIEPPLEILVGGNDPARLHELRTAIVDLIATNRSERFPVDEVGRVVGVEGKTYALSVKVSFDSGSSMIVTRRDLERLLAQIDIYIANPALMSRLKLTPMQYKECTFLLIHNFEQSLNRDIKRICRDIDARGSNKTVHCQWIRVPVDPFGAGAEIDHIAGTADSAERRTTEDGQKR